MAVTVNAAIIDEKDTVVVAIEKINAGDEVIWRDRNGDVQKITAATDVPMYHKRNGSSKIWRAHWSCSM